MFKCKQLLRRICVVSYVFLLCGGLVNASNLVSKTNTLIGTQGNGWASGYLYPGATYPFGMVQFTPTYFTKQLGFVINQLSGADAIIWEISLRFRLPELYGFPRIVS